MENKEKWQNAMNEVVAAWTASPIGSLYEVADKYELKPPTLKERFLDIPYRFAYYLSYPFLWLAYQFWNGAKDAYLDIWDKDL